MTFYLCGPTALARGATAVHERRHSDRGREDGQRADHDDGGLRRRDDHAAGRYCLRADYSGDASVGVPASSDSSVERVLQGHTAPAGDLDTVASAMLPRAAYGSATDNMATLTGTAERSGRSNADGTITFNLNGAER